MIINLTHLTFTISMINIKEFFKSVYTATFSCVFMGFRYHEKLKKEYCPSINQFNFDLNRCEKSFHPRESTITNIAD